MDCLTLEDATDRPSQNVAFHKSEALGYTAAEACSLFHSPQIATAVCSNLRKPRDNEFIKVAKYYKGKNSCDAIQHPI